MKALSVLNLKHHAMNLHVHEPLLDKDLLHACMGLDDGCERGPCGY